MGAIQIVSAFVAGLLAGLGLSLGTSSPREANPRSRGTKVRSNYKMVLVVNTSLKMGKGKIGTCTSLALGWTVCLNVHTVLVLISFRCSMRAWGVWSN